MRFCTTSARHTIRVTVHAVVLAWLAGCGADSSKTTSAAGEAAEQTLTLSQGSDVMTMDPYQQNESPTLGLLINIFDPLIDISPELELVPALAESWENLDSLHWELKLREGVKFHNGADFDAEDVRFSILRARDWAGSRQKSEVGTVKEVRAIDAFTVRIETNVPDAILPRRLISIYMMDRETSEEAIANEDLSWLSTHPNGTGPYRLEQWRPEEYCLLSANENHWRGAPEIKRLKFLAVSNDATRVAAFLGGQIDLLSRVPVRDVERVKRAAGFRVLSQAGQRLIYLGLDVARDASPGVAGSPPNPLKDIRVRRAIRAAIDTDLIVEKVMNGQAEAAEQLLALGVIGHDPDLQSEPFDLEKARALLAEAGYGEGFELRLDAPNDRYVNDAEIAQAIASQLAKIGIRIDVRAQPKANFFADESNGDVSFFLIGWKIPNGDGYSTFDNLLHTRDEAKNLGGGNTATLYSNPELDRITEAAASQFDPELRAEMLRQATRIAMADLPHIPLHFQMDIYAVSDAIEWTPRRDNQLRGIEMRRR